LTAAIATVVHAGTPENLPRFLHFIEATCARIEADADTKYALHLAMEEVCTNLIVHGYRGRPPVRSRSRCTMNAKR
jgi:anti-sigma regulatory factor (Ser/Thr protein kinase)